MKKNLMIVVAVATIGFFVGLGVYQAAETAYWFANRSELVTSGELPRYITTPVATTPAPICALQVVVLNEGKNALVAVLPDPGKPWGFVQIPPLAGESGRTNALPAFVYVPKGSTAILVTEKDGELVGAVGARECGSAIVSTDGVSLRREGGDEGAIQIWSAR